MFIESRQVAFSIGSIPKKIPDSIEKSGIRNLKSDLPKIYLALPGRKR